MSESTAQDTPTPEQLPALVAPQKVIAKDPLEGMAARERELIDMLRYRRPARSGTEKEFINKFVRPLGTEEDEIGNHVITVGEGSPILWSCHTDTVHTKDGMQKLMITMDRTTVFAKKSNCLGADCSVGVWLMANMVRAGIPGTYVFHAAEEKGGIGSKWMATNKADWLKQFKFAIAFDRKDTSEIITHQLCGRTASDDFANSLAQCLKPLEYGPSEHGTFTDTAFYADIIPECTNIGVGYYKQHQTEEYQDMVHAAALLDQLLVADFSRLVCVRDPSEVPPAKEYSGYKGYNGYGGVYGPDYWDEYFDKRYDSRITNTGATVNGKPLTVYKNPGSMTRVSRQNVECWEVLDYVHNYPDEIANMLESYGVTTDELEEYIFFSR